MVATRDDTRSKIVDAAARLLQEGGTDAVTTRGVAERAGMQAPAIYRIFGDKDGLLDAVAEYVMATYVAAKSDVVDAAVAENVDPVEDLRSGWQTYVDFGLANPTLFPLLNDPARAVRSTAVQSGKHVLEARVHRLALTGRLRVAEARAVEMVHSAGSGAVLTLLSMPAGQRDRGLADDMFDAVLSGLLAKPLSRAKNTTRAAAVTLRAALVDLEPFTAAERRLLGEWLDRLT